MKFRLLCQLAIILKYTLQLTMNIRHRDASEEQNLKVNEISSKA